MDLETERSEITDSVVHVDRQETWTAALFASFTPSDRHVSDDEIFEILEAGAEPEAAAELCAAKGVTVPMYCVWKSKYRHLNLEELREARRREVLRARGLLVGFLVIAVLGASGIVYALGRATHATVAGAAPAAEASTAAAPVQARVAPMAELAPPAINNPPQPTPKPLAPPDALPRVTESGYAIQVAAPPTLPEGRSILDRLASAGYPAFLSRAVVSNAEVFRVRVGPFDTLAAAEEVASQLRRDGYSAAWIAR